VLAGWTGLISCLTSQLWVFFDSSVLCDLISPLWLWILWWFWSLCSCLVLRRSVCTLSAEWTAHHGVHKTKDSVSGWVVKVTNSSMYTFVCIQQCDVCTFMIFVCYKNSAACLLAHWKFLPARHYASAVNSDRNLSVCPSVRLSVTRRYCVKTKKASVMISSPSGNNNNNNNNKRIMSNDFRSAGQTVTVVLYG